MLGRKTFLSVLSLLFVRLIQGIILLVAVSRFSTTEFGYFAVAQSLLAFLLFFSDLNLSTAHLKLMAEEKDKNVAFSTYFYLKISLIIISSITFIFIVLFSLNVNILSNDIEQVLIITIVFFDRVLISVLMVYSFSFQATFQIAKKEIATIVGQIIGFMFGLIAILILNNFILYLLNTTISNLLTLLLSIYYGKEFKLTKIKRSLLIRYFKLNLVFVLPFFLNVIIINLGPLIYLQHFGEQLLGVYSVIASFFLMIQGIEQVFRSLLIPNYSASIKNGNFDEIRTLIKYFEKYMAILNGVIIILGIIFGDYFLRIAFGQVYLDNGFFLYIGYLISLISFSLIGPYTPLIVASEKFKIYTLSLSLTLIFSVISWVFLIPIFGLVAIDLGRWLVLIPQTVLIRYYCVKYYKTGRLSLSYTLNLIFIIIMVGLSLFIFSINLIIIFRIIFSVIILVFYFGFLLFTKLFTKKDLKYIIDVIHPGKMVHYIMDETLDN